MEEILYLTLDNQLTYLENKLGGFFKQSYQGIFRKGLRFPITEHAYILDSIENKVSEILDYNIPLTLKRNEVLLNGKMEPIADFQNVQIHKNISNVNFHPIIAAELLLDLIYFTVYINNPYKELYWNDPLNITNNVILDMPSKIKHLVYQEDVISQYLFGKLEIDNANERERLIFNLAKDTLLSGEFNRITEFILKQPTAIYSIDISTTVIKITRGEDIRAVRYNLAIEYGEVNG